MASGRLYGGGGKIWWWWKGNGIDVAKYIEGKNSWVLGLASAR